MESLQTIDPKIISSAVEHDPDSDVRNLALGFLIASPGMLLPAPFNFLLFAIGIFAAVVSEHYLFSRLRFRQRQLNALSRPKELPGPSPYSLESRAEVWEQLFDGYAASNLVYFSYGTVVLVSADESDATQFAKQILEEFGHAVPGTSSADMVVYPLRDSGDFIVGCHHPSIFSYVPATAIDNSSEPERLLHGVGMLGREFRRLDAFELDSVHVQTLAS